MKVHAYFKGINWSNFGSQGPNLIGINVFIALPLIMVCNHTRCIDVLLRLYCTLCSPVLQWPWDALQLDVTKKGGRRTERVGVGEG